MPDFRAERTSYLGLLALMIATADTENWSYPYWNVRQIDAALAALAQAARDGTVPLLAPAGAPTCAVSATPGSIAAGVSFEIGQTWVDEYGRETDIGPLATVSTGAGVADPDTAPTLGTPTTLEVDGFEGGLLEVWFSWTDGSGGETLASPSDQVDIPYQSGGFRSHIDVTLPCIPAAAGAEGANLYARHRGGNIVLIYRIEVDDVDQAHLTGAIADCYRSLPLASSAGSNKAIDITGAAAPAGAELTRFYVRTTGASWPAADRRLKLGGADEWDPATVSYPLVYTGASTELSAGFPPTVSQVKAIRPIDLSTEAMGTLPVDHLPAAATLETEVVKSIGEGLLSGFAVTPNAPADMKVDVATGEALMAAGRFTPAGGELTIPTADPALDRIDIICLADDGVIEGPAENASLRGTPGADPDPPSAPSGYICLAEILVTHADTEIAAGDVTDRRVFVQTLAAYQVAETAARIAADDAIAEDLDDHVADAEAHSSKPGTFTTVNDDCAGSSTSDFEIPNTKYILVTCVTLVCTSEGVIDYDLELFTNSGRTTLAYKAEGIADATWEDRIPWEYFSNGNFYGRITNNSGDAITNLAITLKYRK